MKRTGAFTKSLAIVGTVLVWIPLVAPLVFTRWAALGTSHFNFDWLMPAELLPAAVVGGALLAWAAMRARSRRALVAWGLAIVVVSLAGSQVIAVVTGLASGAVEPTGLPVMLVMGMLAIYAAAVAELGVSGILLIRDTFARAEVAPPETGAPPEA